MACFRINSLSSYGSVNFRFLPPDTFPGQPAFLTGQPKQAGTLAPGPPELNAVAEARRESHMLPQLLITEQMEEYFRSSHLLAWSPKETLTK